MNDTPADISKQAWRIARALDRICRAPGRYVIHITIPPHRRHPWQVEISRVDTLQQMEAKRTDTRPVEVTGDQGRETGA